MTGEDKVASSNPRSGFEEATAHIETADGTSVNGGVSSGERFTHSRAQRGSTIVAAGNARGPGVVVFLRPEGAIQSRTLVPQTFVWNTKWKALTGRKQIWGRWSVGVAHGYDGSGLRPCSSTFPSTDPIIHRSTHRAFRTRTQAPASNRS